MAAYTNSSYINNFLKTSPDSNRTKLYILFIQRLRWLTTIYNCFLQLPFSLKITPATQASKTKQNVFRLFDPGP